MAEPNASLAMLVNDVSQQVDGELCDADGVMIDWKRASSELSTTGLLFLILSLILLNGRTISDGEHGESGWLLAVHAQIPLQISCGPTFAVCLLTRTERCRERCSRTPAKIRIRRV